ncbi:DUF3179 domain-containing protein [Aliamphritea ceti]|uniref:DUF3179 domain-containing protein n=1 Tax=Aliamphritea ceti TaxID=1524258 RepID=UPI0021C49A98|nr:DUF3179 domain-containing protein [Aliamphritea ceti]
MPLSTRSSQPFLPGCLSQSYLFKCGSFLRALLFSLILLPGALCTALQANSLNGFDLSDSLLDARQILSGGPSRDGIPSIDNPRFIRAAEAGWLSADARVMGVMHNGIAKAYPIAILDWHEIVNDQFGEGADNALVITYCPLCGTGVVYQAAPTGEVLSFGVSGLLYNSDVLLYDRQTESLWSQLQNRAIAGAYKGQRLQPVTAQYTSWQSWQRQHPQTLVLSRDTGYSRDYLRSPYGNYDTSTNLYFPVSFLSKAYHPKERVLGLELNGEFKAYPFAELAKLGSKGQVYDELAGQQILIRYDAEQRSGRIWLVTPADSEQEQDAASIPAAQEHKSQGTELSVVNSFWFAWFAFHPEGEVFHADSN